MQVKKELVTPQQARVWLDEKNTQNRRLSPTHVNRFKGIIEAGQWQTLPILTIVFGEDGTLLDGQHRLAAIVAADIPVEQYIATGAPDEAMLATTERPRTAADILLVYRGLKDVTKRASIVGYVVRHGHRKTAFSKLSPDDVLMWWDRVSEPTDEVMAAVHHNTRKPVTSPILSVGVRAILGGEDKAKVCDFLAVMRDNLPVNGHNCTAPLSLARQILTTWEKSGASATQVKGFILRTETALRAFLDGRGLKLVKVTTARNWLLDDMDWPEIAP
jgi:hypothetical protein